MLKTININTTSRCEFIDITEKVKDALSESGIKSGVCYVYVPHTTAGVMINEGADPSVQRDIEKTFSRLIPHQGDYRHDEGNSDAHIKSVITGASQSVIIDNGKLVLGTWQSIFFCEFDGPRNRKVLVKTTSG
ncbi:MAG: secondary thiamine-phosphate synthase enzyme YjbQ [Thermodesulfovibrionia bacterium]|nr:secondary thiamine-phosphate synthase enzyme YjbQ [Thermodesulfovibrionia bacterium]